MNGQDIRKQSQPYAGKNSIEPSIAFPKVSCARNNKMIEDCSGNHNQSINNQICVEWRCIGQIFRQEPNHDHDGGNSHWEDKPLHFLRRK
jgi:hypothetical protein